MITNPCHRRQDVYKQKAEHGHAVYCNGTASGPLRGGDAARRGKGNNEVVVPEGYRLREGKSEGSGAEMESESESETDMEREATRDAESRASGSSGAEWSRASADEWEVMQTSSYTT